MEQNPNVYSKLTTMAKIVVINNVCLGSENEKGTIITVTFIFQYISKKNTLLAFDLVIEMSVIIRISFSFAKDLKSK